MGRAEGKPSDVGLVRRKYGVCERWGQRKVEPQESQVRAMNGWEGRLIRFALVLAELRHLAQRWTWRSNGSEKGVEK